MMKTAQIQTKRLAIVLCFMLIAVATSCTGEEEPESSNLTANTQNQNNDNRGDAGTDDVEDDADVEDNNYLPDPCEDVECDDDFACSEGECVPIADEGYWCDEPYELGELQDRDTRSITANGTGQPSTVDTSCSNVEGGNAIISFTVAEPMDVRIELGNHEIQQVMEIREDSCTDPMAVREDFGTNGCQPIVSGSTYVLDAEPDKTYYLLVEARHDGEPGQFTLDFEAIALVCAPKGSWYCHAEDDDTITQCWAGTEERSHQCGTGCENDECRGDGCHNAIEVTAPVTFAGEMGTHLNSNFNFLPHPECSSESASTEGPRTTGQDLVFYFPGLFAGQTVMIDTTGTSTLNFFGVVTECNEESVECIFGESMQQVMEWEVQEDGDYYVIVNQEPPTGLSDDATYQYEIDILD